MPTELSGLVKKSNRLRIILIFLGVVGLVSGGIYFKLRGEGKVFEKSPLSTIRTSLTTSGLTNLEIAEKTLAWLDKQRDDRGIYFAQRSCSTSVEGKTTCDKVVRAGTSGHEGLSAMYARFRYYQVKKRDEDLEVLLNDIDNYSDSEKISWVQNDFWNCSFMYDLWQSDLFNQEQKKKIEEICWTSTYYLPEEIEFGLFDGKYQTRIKNELADVDLKGKKLSDVSKENEENLVQFLDDYSSYPSDFVARYFWKSDEKDLKMAKIYFNKVAGLYWKKNQYFNGKNVCLLGVSSIDLFKVTENQDYLDFAELIYEKNLKGELSSPQFVRPECGIFSQKLFEATGEKGYEEGRTEITRNYINGFFDFAGYYRNVLGNGSFSLVNDDGSFGLTREIRNNGLVLILLAYD